jgi:hypothetical protein
VRSIRLGLARPASLVAIISLIASPLAGCATTHGPRRIDDESGPFASNWSRVRQLKPAAEIVVTVGGLEPKTRHFVLADESALLVLNLADHLLPANSTRVLRNMAAQHPAYFTAMQDGRAFAEGDVRVGRDGLFVANRKVADLEQVVERFARNDITEIRGPVVARGSVSGAVLGGWLGFAAGAVPGLGGAPETAAWALVIGSVTLGSWLGFRWSSHETDGIVYRAAPGGQ